MSAQQGGTKRNFIALVSDPNEQRRTVSLPANPDRQLRDYVLALMAAMLKRRGDASQPPRPLASPVPGKTG